MKINSNLQFIRLVFRSFFLPTCITKPLSHMISSVNHLMSPQILLLFYYISSSSVATFDTQSIDITSTSGEVCVVCRFSINTKAVGCEIHVLQNNNITLSGRFNRDVNNIAEGCVSNITTGYYDLYVYDVENDNTLSQSPAIIKNQVFVDEQATTSSTTMSTSSSISSISTTSTS